MNKLNEFQIMFVTYIIACGGCTFSVGIALMWRELARGLLK